MRKDSSRRLAGLCFSLLLLAFGSPGCANKPSSSSTIPSSRTKLVLTAQYTKERPNVDGKADDGVWRKARAATIPTEGGPQVQMKAAYREDRIFFLATWDDRTNDAVDQVWRFDGQKWTQDVSDDAFSVFWNIDNSVADFNQKGCAVVCHQPSGDPRTWRMELVGPTGRNKAWSGRDARGDIWDISLGISNVKHSVNDFTFSIDPNYLKYSGTSGPPVVFRRHDAFVYRAPWQKNYVKDTSTGELRPRVMLKPGLTIETTPYPTTEQIIEITDYSLFGAGDSLPFMVFSAGKKRWGGSKDDIEGKGVWQNGRWTVEMERKLDTGHQDDIQFRVAGTGSTYYVFAIAVFDHTITGHYPSPPVSLDISGKAASQR